MIARVLDSLAATDGAGDPAVEAAVKAEVEAVPLSSRFTVNLKGNGSALPILCE